MRVSASVWFLMCCMRSFFLSFSKGLWTSKGRFWKSCSSKHSFCHFMKSWPLEFSMFPGPRLSHRYIQYVCEKASEIPPQRLLRESIFIVFGWQLCKFCVQALQEAWPPADERRCPCLLVVAWVSLCIVLEPLARLIVGIGVLRKSFMGPGMGR